MLELVLTSACKSASGSCGGVLDMSAALPEKDASCEPTSDTAMTNLRHV